MERLLIASHDLFYRKVFNLSPINRINSERSRKKLYSPLLNYKESTLTYTHPNRKREKKDRADKEEEEKKKTTGKNSLSSYLYSSSKP